MDVDIRTAVDAVVLAQKGQRELIEFVVADLGRTRARLAETQAVCRDLIAYLESLDHREPAVVAATARQRLDQLDMEDNQ